MPFFGLLEDIVTALGKEVDLLDVSQLTLGSWKQLYGMRNRIVHGYSGVNMSIVWDTIHEDLPLLKVEIEKYLK